jgi:hypothetical protein
MRQFTVIKKGGFNWGEATTPLIEGQKYNCNAFPEDIVPQWKALGWIKYPDGE